MTLSLIVWKWGMQDSRAFVQRLTSVVRPDIQFSFKGQSGLLEDEDGFHVPCLREHIHEDDFLKAPSFRKNRPEITAGGDRIAGDPDHGREGLDSQESGCDMLGSGSGWVEDDGGWVECVDGLPCFFPGYIPCPEGEVVQSKTFCILSPGMCSSGSRFN